MSSAFVMIALCAATPPCCDSSHGLAYTSGAYEQYAGHYHQRVYTGFYTGYPYDYRLTQDYPWHPGPSRGLWPIPPTDLTPRHIAPARLHRPSPQPPTWHLEEVSEPPVTQAENDEVRPTASLRFLSK